MDGRILLDEGEVIPSLEDIIEFTSIPRPHSQPYIQLHYRNGHYSGIPVPIIMLDLRGIPFGGIIPETIGTLTSLVSLTLCNNQLEGAIPETIGLLTNLKTLSLSNNRLEGAIPESIGSLKYLEYLNLSKNRLEGAIPESIGSLIYLEHLILANNRLEGAIPESISRLGYLQSLYLSGNQLSGEGFQHICQLRRLGHLSADNFWDAFEMPQELMRYGHDLHERLEFIRNRLIEEENANDLK